MGPRWPKSDSMFSVFFRSKFMAQRDSSSSTTWTFGAAALASMPMGCGGGNKLLGFVR